ncbi:hypothetical protein L0F63_003966, partial [Massospora cicadina]
MLQEVNPPNDNELQAGPSGESNVIQLGFVAPFEGSDEALEPAFTARLGGIRLDFILRCWLTGKADAIRLRDLHPEDYPPQAYHRVLYVFICPNGACSAKSRARSIKVIRCQLPRENDYYELDDSKPLLKEGDGKDSLEEKWVLKRKVDAEGLKCWVCGVYAGLRCSKCRIAQYCGKPHQLWDWNRGNHRNTCSSGPTPPDFSLKPLSGYPPQLIECECEKTAAEMAQDEMKRVGRLLDQVSLSKAEASDKQLAVPGDEACEDTKVEVDPTFLAFQRRIDYDPSQILRYARTNYGRDDAEPLWVSDLGKPSATDILPCQICGQPRAFEMQILPQLLHFLPIDHSNPVALDWGTYVIYTCPNNCCPDPLASCPDVFLGGSPSGKQVVYVTEDLNLHLAPSKVVLEALMFSQSNMQFGLWAEYEILFPYA